jgi:hypothetical protein
MIALGGLVLLAMTSLLAVGCGEGGGGKEPKLTVKGKVTDNGTPLALDPKLAASKAASIPIRFVREGDAKNVFAESAFVNSDGSYEIKVPKGKYRIGIQHLDGPGGDKLKGKFEERKSPIVKDVTTEGQQIDIDLAKPE